MAILAQDTFQRADGVGWGTASDGKVWSQVLVSGGANDWAITSNAGQTNGVGGYYLLGDGTASDVDLLVESPIVDIVGNDNFGAIARSNADGTAAYWAVIYAASNQLALVRVGVRHDEIEEQLALSAFTYASGVPYKLRFRVTGEVTVLLQAKIWEASGDEPPDWAVEYTDQDGNQYTSAGRYGIYGEEDAATGHLRFTSFIVTDVPVGGVPMQEYVTLYSPGSLPGIPGDSHGPGVFLIDWNARTIEAVAPDEEEEEATEAASGTEEAD